LNWGRSRGTTPNLSDPDRGKRKCRRGVSSGLRRCFEKLEDLAFELVRGCEIDLAGRAHEHPIAIRLDLLARPVVVLYGSNVDLGEKRKRPVELQHCDYSHAPYFPVANAINRLSISHWPILTLTPLADGAE
jgi:hypothetical protein